MRPVAGLIIVLSTQLACVTFRTDASMQVAEYESVEDMNKFADCESLGVVTAEYEVFLHSPAGRKRAGRTRLRDAAYAKGANAVIMTVNDWGVIVDQVTGVAYRCKPLDQPAAAPQSSAAPTAERERDRSPEERLRVLDRLRSEGLISPAEYQSKRGEILEGL